MQHGYLTLSLVRAFGRRLGSEFNAVFPPTRRQPSSDTTRLLEITYTDIPSRMSTVTFPIKFQPPKCPACPENPTNTTLKEFITGG